MYCYYNLIPMLLASLIKLLDGKDISPISQPQQIQIQEAPLQIPIYDRYSVPFLLRSNKSMTEYSDFLGELCMKSNIYTDDLKLYMQWEERNFLHNIRILLIPETENGDLTSINDPKNADLLRVADYRMFTTLEVKNQCPKKNTSATNDLTQYKVNTDTRFQDHIIDLLLDE